MNRVNLSGNATKDVVLQKTNSGLSFCSFGVAVKRNFKNNDGEYETDFINCVAWRTTADYLAKYLKKGSKVIVSGAIQTRTYDATDGTKKYVTEVVVDDAEVLSTQPRPQEESNQPTQTNTNSFGGSKAAGKSETIQTWTPIDDDNELPF